MTLDVSVIVCAYTEERWEDLVAAVESVRQQHNPPREIIVVIDHNPKLLERSRNSIPNVIVVENKEERGLSGARNSGVAIARGAVIAFLDDDAIAAPDWLENLNTGYARSNVVGVGGAIEPMWPSRRPSWFPYEFDWVVGCVYRGMPQETAPVRNLIGANMSFHREVFEKAGSFRLGKVGTRSRPEETELCIRVRQQWPEGIWLYEPRARVFHRVPADRASFRYFLTRCYNEGLGKAAMVHFVGPNDGLSAERNYTFKTLPNGIWQGMGDALLRGKPAGLARAGAIVAGLTITTVGYIIGAVLLRLKGSKVTANQVNPI